MPADPAEGAFGEMKPKRVALIFAMEELLRNLQEASDRLREKALDMLFFLGSPAS